MSHPPSAPLLAPSTTEDMSKCNTRPSCVSFVVGSLMVFKFGPLWDTTTPTSERQKHSKEILQTKRDQSDCNYLLFALMCTTTWTPQSKLAAARDTHVQGRESCWCDTTGRRVACHLFLDAGRRTLITYIHTYTYMYSYVHVMLREWISVVNQQPTTTYRRSGVDRAQLLTCMWSFGVRSTPTNHLGTYSPTTSTYTLLYSNSTIPVFYIVRWTSENRLSDHSHVL